MSVHILIVDDEPTVVSLLERILAKESIFDVEAVNTGYDAIKRCAFHVYDAIICDINLPDIDGPDVVNELKMKKICPPTVIYISGVAKAAPHDMAGDTYFIKKPFNPGQIMSVLSHLKRP